MPYPTLTYIDGENDHKAIADDLGLLQRGVSRNVINKATPNSYFLGVELKAVYGTPQGFYYLKKDAVSNASSKKDGQFGRTTRRVIVKVDSSTNQLIENFALLWNHKLGFVELGAGFFKRALFLRNM